MAPLALSLLKHSPLLCATDSNLHDDARAGDHFLRLDSDLLCQFTGWRNNNAADVVWSGALVSSDLLAELGVVRDNSLDDRDEETECFTGTGLCLCDAAGC
jgi:hypothetical protein